MNPPDTIASRLKLDGKGQAFHTNNVMRRMKRYMGLRSGTMIRQMVTGTDVRTGVIRVATPYARMQFYGVSKNGKRINYNTSGNALAGPLWSDRMMSAEGDQIRLELGRFLEARVTK